METYQEVVAKVQKRTQREGGGGSGVSEPVSSSKRGVVGLHELMHIICCHIESPPLSALINVAHLGRLLWLSG